MERAAHGHRNQGAKILARTHAYSLQNVFFFLHLLHRLVYLLVKQGVVGEGKHSLRVEDFERMPDGGEGSEGKKTEFVCMTRA